MMPVEKNKTIEEQMEVFLRALKEDKEKIPFLIRFIERMTFDTMSLGEKGFQPVLAFTLFVKREGQDKLKIRLRPVRTPSQETYEAFQFERLGELINEAFGQYGKEVWGMTPVDEKDNVGVDGEKALSQWGHLTKEQAH